MNPTSLPAFGGIDLTRALSSLRALERGARAFWLTDLDAVAARVARLRAAFQPLQPRIAYAVKANGLPALLRTVAAAGGSADAGSLGELVAAEAAGFEAARRTLTGNGRTSDEARWAAERGVAFVSADAPGDLDLLESAAAAASTRLAVVLRLNPALAAPTHHHIATGHDEAKFGMDLSDAVALWRARERWPNLSLDGVHVHVGSQVLAPEALLDAARAAIDAVDTAEHEGVRLTRVDVGGGFGVDYTGEGREFDVERYASGLAELARGRSLEWTLEPGRWLVAPTTVLVAEVLGTKVRRGRCFVVLAAGMNDLIRPALYGARHRIVPVRARPGRVSAATVVGPVCESADTFATDVALPPLERGDLVAVLDAGAYGAAMSSNYNGRGRLAELVAERGVLRRARAGESPDDLDLRTRDDVLG